MHTGPVTEIALCSIKNPQPSTVTDEDLSSRIPSEVRDLLHHAASEQAAYSGYPVTLLQCQEDPSLLFLIGGWNSVSKHMDEWIPEPINQGLMKALGDHVDIHWMFHVDAEPRERSKTSTIGRYTARDGTRALCDTQLRSVRDGSTARAFSHGWRLDTGLIGDEKQAGSGIELVETTIVVFTVAGAEDEAKTLASVTEILETSTVKQEAYTVKMWDCVQPSHRV